MGLPLDGLRVLAVEQYGAGPYCSLHLASLGAEVIKIEPPITGDVSRTVGPYFLDEMESSAKSLFYQGLNHNKKSIVIDLKTEAGKEVLRSLVKTSDGLISNLRGDVVTHLGLDYESLRDANKSIVCAHLTAYGRTGDRADWPGYDYVMQAQAGYFSLTGEPDAPPTRFGLSVVDLQAGVTLAMALLAGVLSARATGIGRDLDVSLFDVALHNLNYVGMWALNTDYVHQRTPRSAHYSLTPCQLYKSKDGWIYIMCNKEKFWIALCEKIGRPDLISNPQFLDFKQRLENRDELSNILDEVLVTRTTAQWLEHFSNKVPAAPVLSLDEALSQDFVKNSSRIVSYRTDNGSEVRAIRPPVHLDDDFELKSAPEIGGQTDTILSELSYSKEHIAELRKNRTVQ